MNKKECKCEQCDCEIEKGKWLCVTDGKYASRHKTKEDAIKFGKILNSPFEVMEEK